jgi:uncharacterized membrane protein
MTDPALDALRQEQARLRREIDALGQKLDALAWDRLPAPAAAPEPPAVPPVLATRPPPLPEAAPFPLPEPAATAPRESFELHLGRVWLVRIGIGMLLTGLIFLASFAYQRWAASITPFERAAGLFVVSLGLAGLGLWLEQSREALRHYGRVLAAGGLAGGYYALYASHYVPALRWIASGLASNLLLMAWAGAIIGIACRRRAQTLGVAAIVLAYYTSLLGPDLSYTLVSNLILGGAAVFLTLRYGWKFASYAALGGTYGIYAFSRMSHGLPGGFSDAGVVAGYWLLFALALLWPRVGGWEKGERVLLLTLNNGAYLLLGAFALAAPFAHVFPDFAMVFGAVLAGTACLSRRLLPEERDQEAAFLVEGIACATLGWISRWHGPSGALVLAVEGGLLLFASGGRQGRALRVLSALAAAAACAWGTRGIFDAAPWTGEGIPLLLAALFAGQGLWLLRGPQTAARSLGAAYFAALAGLLYLLWVGEWVPTEHQCWVLAASGAAAYAAQFARPTRFVNGIAIVCWGWAAFVFAFLQQGGIRTSWANGAALVGLFALEQAAVRRVPAAFLSRPGQGLWLSLVFAGAWVYGDRLAHAWQPDLSPTLAWAVLAVGLFALGLACRERIARGWGLGLLAAALGRVLCVDVWQLGTLSRIFTFLGLGAILLVLGFVYNRYQETLKRWL